MGKKNSKDFFWPSYVDVMTNLFAITLVLFVVSFFLFKGKNDVVIFVLVEKVGHRFMHKVKTAVAYAKRH